MRKSRAIIQRSQITLKEYHKLVKQGYRRLFYKNSPIRVVFSCTRCGREHNSTFGNMIRRNQEYLTLCTHCAGSLSASKNNSNRSTSYYENDNYRMKISQGVKRHYRLNKQSIQDRLAKRRENFDKFGIPSFSAHKSYVEGILCASYGEEVFVKWKLEQRYKVQKCTLSIPYKHKGLDRRYNPDFIISKNNDITIVEVKCEFLKNFPKDGESTLRNLMTYKLDEIRQKNIAVKRFCKKKGWRFLFLTLDDRNFNLLYNRAKRKRQYENKKKGKV